MADLGIMVVTQPSFIYFSGDRYLKTVSRRSTGASLCGRLDDEHGLRVGFSSDFPLSDANPMVGIQAAVTRMTEEGDSVLPHERISVLDALRRIRTVRQRPVARRQSRDPLLTGSSPI